MAIKKFPSRVVRNLGYYVYLLIDPEKNEIFYVGKGKGNRCFEHLNGDNNSPAKNKISDLRKRGIEPQIEILIHGLSNEKAAYMVEMASIDLLGIDLLVNRVHGHHSRIQGRMTLDEIVSQYEREQVTIKEKVILIRISRLYHYGITPMELYDVTRGIWKVGSKRDQVEYAFAVYQGIVKEVYSITQWFPAGQTYRHNLSEHKHLARLETNTLTKLLMTTLPRTAKILFNM